jgi:hypothetical protein
MSRSLRRSSWRCSVPRCRPHDWYSPRMAPAMHRANTHTTWAAWRQSLRSHHSTQMALKSVPAELVRFTGWLPSAFMT